MRKKFFLMLVASAAALIVSDAALAQNGGSAGDIIVTARKRQETILNVPVIETALPQALLDRRATTDLKDVANIVPGLKLSVANGILGTQVSLRGVGTTAINVGIDASVALNVDGLQITQSTAFASAVFDLAQIEVLKGPQSLFYGKNSPGGVIALHTADPTDKFELIGRYGHELEAHENREELIISGPVTDTLKLRLAGFYDTQDGYFHNIAVAVPGLGGVTPASGRAPNARNYTVRGTALWTPNSQLTARLKVNIAGTRTQSEYSQFVSCPDGTGAISPYFFPFLGNENCKLNRNTNVLSFNPKAFGGLPNNGIPFLDSKTQFGSLDLTFRPIDSISITSTTGYFHIRSHSLGSGGAATASGPTFVSRGMPLDRRDVTEEVRINSDFTGPLNFTAGGYYQHGRLNNRVNLPSNQTLNLNPNPAGPVIHLPATIGNYQEIVKINSISGFAQVRYQVVPQIELAAGARITHEKRDLAAFNYVSGSAVAFPTAVPTISSTNVSPEFTVTYKPSDDVTLFASYKKAFKSGSFTLTALTMPNPDLSFGDEEAQGFETGVKARLFDRSVTTSLAFYDYKYKGLQVGTVTPVTSGVPVNRTLNAGAAKVYGVDFDATYQPGFIDGLNLKGSLEWNHGRFQSLLGVPCYGGQTVAAGCNQGPVANGQFTTQDLSGLPLVRAPDWQASFGFDYELPVLEKLKLILANDNQYSSSYVTTLSRRADTFQSAYFKFDLSATLKAADDRWEVSVVGKNLGDKLTTGNCLLSNTQGGAVLGGQITGGTGRGPAGVDEAACFIDTGRAVWLRVTLRPFG